MGCEACQSHVRRILDGSPGVFASKVDLDTGTASLIVHEQWGFNLTTLAQRYVPYPLPISRRDAQLGEFHMQGTSDALCLSVIRVTLEF